MRPPINPPAGGPGAGVAQRIGKSAAAEAIVGAFRRVGNARVGGVPVRAWCVELVTAGLFWWSGWLSAAGWPA